MARAGFVALDGVAEPGGGVEVFEDVEDGLGLVDVGDGLDGEKVGFRVEQGFDPWPVPLCELPFGESVAAAVFGAVGEVGAVGADGGGDVTGSIGFPCGLAGEDDTAVQEFRGGGAVDAAVGEAVVGGR